jgi:CPA1 family monovalent cation:H+ antiporter
LPEFSIFSLGLVLLTASLVAIISRRLKLPYSVGLVMAGITLALLPIAIELPLTRDLIFNIFLPPLIFEAALRLEWKAFRRELPLTAGLAFPDRRLRHACPNRLGLDRRGAVWRPDRRH